MFSTASITTAFNALLVIRTTSIAEYMAANTSSNEYQTPTMRTCDVPDSTIMRISRVPWGRIAPAVGEYRSTSACTCQILYEMRTTNDPWSAGTQYMRIRSLTRAQQVQYERDGIEILDTLSHDSHERVVPRFDL